MSDDIGKRIDDFIARLDRAEAVVDPRLAAHGGVQGVERIARLIEAQDGPEFDVELQYANAEARPLFTVREMVHGTGSAFGVRHEESGCWHPLRLSTRARAEMVRDGLLLNWLEGYESILVENFQSLTGEGQ